VTTVGMEDFPHVGNPFIFWKPSHEKRKVRFPACLGRPEITQRLESSPDLAGSLSHLAVSSAIPAGIPCHLPPSPGIETR